MVNELTMQKLIVLVCFAVSPAYLFLKWESPILVYGSCVLGAIFFYMNFTEKNQQQPQQRQYMPPQRPMQQPQVEQPQFQADQPPWINDPYNFQPRQPPILR